MATSPNSLMMTAARLMPGWRSSRRSSVVLPLPRNPMMTASQRHLEDVEPADETIHRVDDAPVIDIDIVQLDRAGGRPRRRARNEIRHFPWPERIADVVRANAGVEECADDDLVGGPRRGHGQILVQVVRAEAAA